MNLKKVFVPACLLVAVLLGCSRSVMPEEGDRVSYWNLSSTLILSIDGEYSEDNEFKVSLFNGEEEVFLSNNVGLLISNRVELNIDYPADLPVLSGSNFLLTVKRKGSLFDKNKFYLELDRTPPQLSIIAKSDEIQRGGTAAIVAQAGDDHRIRGVWVSDQNGMRFNAQTFQQESYYATLFGWNVEETTFNPILIAEDMAGNQTTNEIRGINQLALEITTSMVYLTTPEEKEETNEVESTTTTTTTTTTIAEEEREPERFITIWETTTRQRTEAVSNWSVGAFDPIPEAIQTSGFGRLRTYYLDGDYLRENYHAGIDMMLRVNNDIWTSNPGEVVYAQYNGGYGYVMLIYHGFGLYSLYGHTSAFFFRVGESVRKGEVVALTGQTGAASGDHLHFGINVQGLDVNPGQWMDQDWINENILAVLDNARRIMEQRERS